MAEKLAEYKRKRDFKVTDEPEGKPKNGKSKELLFAVQLHAASRLHYDLRLEWDGVLLSWAVPKGPSYNPSDKRLAVKVEDHPYDYARFEGAIPQGQYGGGTVMLWDLGVYTPLGDFSRQLDEGALKFELDGSRLKGKWTLVRLKPKEGETGDNWLLIKEQDEWVRPSAGISQYDTSVSTGRTMDEIADEESVEKRSNPFKRVDVQLARLAEDVPEGDDWLYEVKYDGYRILAFTEGGHTRLMTRNDRDFTDKFQSVADSIDRWASGRAMILDGEMVVTDDDGRTDFQALQQYVKSPGGKDLQYMLFDLLALDGEDLRARPLLERKEKLKKLLEKAPGSLAFSNHVIGRGRESFEAAAELELEGVIAKRVDSAYRGERNGDWIKLKCYRRQEFVVGGYTRTDKKSEGVSALLLGLYRGDVLTYAGRAGTGIDRRAMKQLSAAFEGLEADESPFSTRPRAKGGEKIFWLKPRLVAEVQFAEFTGEDRLRQASFKGLRLDKDAEDVVAERPQPIESESGKSGKTQSPLKSSVKKIGATAKSSAKGGKSARKGAAEKSSPRATASKAKKATAAKSATADASPQASATGARSVKRTVEGKPLVSGVAISNPGKMIYANPEVTKMAVVEYYAAAAERMLPYLEERVLSVVRCHNGANKACFFKKHPNTTSPGVRVVPVKNSEGKTSDYFCIEDGRGLIAEAQLGSLEFHTWGSRIETIEKPDMMVFDLDPDEGMELARVRQGVRDLKGVLEQLGLESFLKTSGGKGYHVVVPLKPKVGWDVFHDFARNVAVLMERRWPDQYTANIRKNKRTGRIFIDWARNGRGATSVAPYSLRARPGACVSLPIAWSELDAVSPNGIDLFEAADRLKKRDPWKGFFQVEQQLKSPL